MARNKRICRRIRSFVERHSLLWTSPGNWYVGVTNAVPRRKAAHERRLGMSLEVFGAWEARSAQDAAAIERRFLAMGMQGAGGGWASDSVFVYVYKWRGPYARRA